MPARQQLAGFALGGTGKSLAYSRARRRPPHDLTPGTQSGGSAARIRHRRLPLKGTAMKISPIAPLALAAVLAVPLASHADTKPVGATKVWVKDSVVTTKIKAQLAASKVSSLAVVHVDTDADGFVQLTGKVATPAEKDRAESIAKAVDGVKSVDNRLTVTGK